MRFEKGRVAIVGAVLVLAIAFGVRRSCGPSGAKNPLGIVAVPAKAVLPPGPARPVSAPVDIRAAIQAGTRMLERTHLDSRKCGARPVWRHRHKIAVTGPKRCVGDYLLAVADERGHITLVEVYEGRPSSPPGYRVTVEAGARRRGVNVPFEVSSPPNRTVVGLRTGVYDGLNVVGGVYVPYSRALDIPELRADGLRYLEKIASGALHDLRKERVKSRFFRGQLVADTVEPQHLVTLVLTEQMKSDRGFVSGDAATQLAMINRTLVILGANLTEAYGFTKSRVGAAGIAQLMPDTYGRLRRAYPMARLPANQDSRLDHGVAMKAMALHADDEWWAVAGDHHYRDWLRTHPEARRLMLAAGYNANVKNVVTAIKRCGDTWRACLPRETQMYLIKYEAVWDLLYGPIVTLSPEIASAGP